MPLSGATTTDFQRLNVYICMLVKLAVHVTCKILCFCCTSIRMEREFVRRVLWALFSWQSNLNSFCAVRNSSAHSANKINCGKYTLSSSSLCHSPVRSVQNEIRMHAKSTLPSAHLSQHTYFVPHSQPKFWVRIGQQSNERKKTTSERSNFKMYISLALVCDYTHTHTHSHIDTTHTRITYRIGEKFILLFVQHRSGWH